MAFDLKNEHGREFRIGGGPWAVYLNLASSFGWQPEGTTLESDPDWRGGYDSNDGQTVSASDAHNLCRHLVTAAHHPKFGFAVADVIRRLEEQIEATGRAIPDAMRIKPDTITESFNDVCLFLNEGSFQIW
ncbi:hypothetical protein [Sphingomonas sp. 22176]|uniref:hypothetical protein n=1 Tax=Sphingomonas sp. 22176 TaxID=3453884 RepID=UPI003F8289F0